MFQNQTIELKNATVEISFCEHTRYQALVKKSNNINKGIIIDTKKDNTSVLYESEFYDTVTAEEYLKFYLNY